MRLGASLFLKAGAPRGWKLETPAREGEKEGKFKASGNGGARNGEAGGDEVESRKRSR